jgi:hypothetical protein
MTSPGIEDSLAVNVEIEFGGKFARLHSIKARNIEMESALKTLVKIHHVHSDVYEVKLTWVARSAATRCPRRSWQ